MLPISVDTNGGTMCQTAYKTIKRKYENLKRIKCTMTKKKILKKMKKDDKKSYDEVNTNWINPNQILPCLTVTNTQRSMIFTNDTEKDQLGELCQSLKQLIDQSNDKKTLLDNLIKNSKNESLLQQLFRNFLTYDIENVKLIELKRILIVWLSLFDQEFETETTEKMEHD